MKNFLVTTVANAVALGVATWVLAGITLSEDGTARKAVTLVLVALLFGVINALVKPIVRLMALPLFVLTLGLFTFVVNALMLWLTSWASEAVGLSFEVDGFWTALLGALIVSVVSWAVSVALPDGE
ncbi:phage holin family protein [Streptomyces capparidis]